MENASKALVMAGGVLIGIMILSLAVYLFIDFGSTSAEINAQNAQKQITEFNSKFTSYEDKEGITIYDVITVVGYAQENNKYYEDSEEYKITVLLDNTPIQDIKEENKNLRIKNDQYSMIGNPPKLPTYKCKVTDYHKNGRVKIITFTKKSIKENVEKTEW